MKSFPDKSFSLQTNIFKLEYNHAPQRIYLHRIRPAAD